MIIVAGQVGIRPEKREAALEAAQRMAAATRQEEGCIAYKFYSDLTDPSILFLFEEWEGPEYLAAHYKTAHMAEYRAAMKELASGVRELNKYEFTSKGEL